MSSLLLQDYIKWRGLFIHRFLAAVADEDDEVSCLAYDDASGKSDCYKMMVTAAATMMRMATMATIMKTLVTKVTWRVVSL